MDRRQEEPHQPAELDDHQPQGLVVVVLGLKGWLAPKGWTAGLPPISLIAVVAALIPLVIKRKRVLEEKERRKPT